MTPADDLELGRVSPTIDESPTQGENQGFKIKTVLPSFTTGFDLTSKEEEEKRKARAARFHVPVHQPEISLASSEDLQKQSINRSNEAGLGVVESTSEEPQDCMDIDVDGDEKEMVPLQTERRWNTVHLYGTKMLNDTWDTTRVLEYFSEYGPSCVEWISDSRCNVVFADKGSSKRALLHLSKSMTKEESGLAADEALSTGIEEEDLPFVAWRLGKGHNPESTLMLRIATVKDIKSSEKKQSKYYEKCLALYRSRRGGRGRKQIALSKGRGAGTEVGSGDSKEVSDMQDDDGLGLSEKKKIRKKSRLRSKKRKEKKQFSIRGLSSDASNGQPTLSKPASTTPSIMEDDMEEKRRQARSLRFGIATTPNSSKQRQN